MKTQSLTSPFFSLLFCSCAFNSPAQTALYHPFPDSGAVWITKNYPEFPDPPFFEYYDVTGRDTIIDSLTYIIIGYSGINADYFYLRNDTLNKKIFFYDDPFNSGLGCGPASYQDTLLYDFSLGVNDTIYQCSYYEALYNRYPFYVLNSDSILIGDKYHRRINITHIADPGFYISWIEEIGSTVGIYPEPGLVCPSLFCTDLWCYIRNGKILYSYLNDTSECHNLIMGYNQKEKNNIDFAVTCLNPVSNTLPIRFYMKYPGELCIDVYSAFGNLNVTNICEFFPSGQNELRIDIGPLSNGLYFYKIISSDLLSTSKFLILK